MDTFKELQPYIFDYDQDIRPVSITQFKTGLSDSRIYKVLHQSGEFVLKIFPKSFIERIVQQIGVVDFLIIHGVPTPKVLKVNYDFLEGYGYLIMEFIEGSTLYDLLLTSDKVDDALSSVANMLYKIHTLPSTPKWQDPSNIITTKTDWIDFVSKRVATAVDFVNKNRDLFSSPAILTHLQNTVEALQGCDTKLVPLHWDYNPQNILVQGDVVTAVLDFESHRIGDPYNDLGIVWYWFKFYDKEPLFYTFLNYYQTFIQSSVNMAVVRNYMILQVISALGFLLSNSKDGQAINRLRKIVDEIN